ncbi:MAG: hypothetical protein JWO12_2609, partial [Frankiales bacterium]|nr:hypothetical protein [Frankiales bacterium]
AKPGQSCPYCAGRFGPPHSLEHNVVTSRPLLVSTAAVSALVLCTSAGSAGAAATAKPAAGSAASVLSLLKVTAGGHQFRLGDLSLVSDTLTGTPLSKIVVTPVTADGTAVGQQVITPDSPSFDVPSQSTPSTLGSLLSLTSPAFVTSATTAPSSHAGSSSLGSVKLLGLPLSLAGSLDLGSSVSSVTGAKGAKSVSVQGLALPSIGDLLAALGLDLSKLPVPTLNTLVGQLGLVDTAVTTARTAATAALAQISTATATVGTATTAVTTATSGVTSATSAVTSATTAIQGQLTSLSGPQLALLPVGASSSASFLQMSTANQALVEALLPNLSSALTSYNSATSALTTAQTALTTATSALAAAQAVLDGLLATLQSTLAPLLSALTNVLDSTPLVSLDRLALTSSATATSNTAGGQKADVLGGTVTGLHVLGTDVLNDVLGTSSLDVTDLVGTTATQLTAAITGLTNTLSTVLSSVPGLPRLAIPAPTVSVLTKSSSTSISGGFGRAQNAVHGLTISIPAITLPTAVALPGAASLPALSGVTQTVSGVLTSSPISLDLLTLSDQAAFSPAVTAVPPTKPTVTPPTAVPSTPAVNLPATGLPAGIAILSFTMIAGALVVRRRTQRA